ncbi:T3SS effector HopA1 family protein [Streptomyces sp. NPDC005840]|uniref:T3SS effector HopA1 family protein n=1 Tax=Streptomyces sp. NPDC005840 TaxID=3157072 RepID=UPI0033D1C432
MTTRLAPSIVRLLAESRVAPDGRSAVVRGRALEGDTRHALRAALAEEFYRVHHMGHTGEPAPPRRSSRDAELEERLLAAMPHRHTTAVVPLPGPVGDTATTAAAPAAAPLTGTSATSNSAAGPGASAAPGASPHDGRTVLLDGVRVALPADRIERAAADGRSARVRLDAARPALSPGFFLCDGSRERRLRSTGTLRVYVHVRDAESAPAVWGAVLTALEEEPIPYRAKVCSALEAFPRQDGLVVYLGAEGWYAAERVAASVQGLPGVGATTSDFVRELAPGVGAAWEPDDRRPGMGRVSFGEHRAAAVASGLLLHHENPGVFTVAQAVEKALLDAGVDPADPARNLGSPRGVLPRGTRQRPSDADAPGDGAPSSRPASAAGPASSPAAVGSS